MSNDFYKHYKNNEYFIQSEFTNYSRIDINSPFLFLEQKNAILIHNLYKNKEISFIEKKYIDIYNELLMEDIIIKKYNTIRKIDSLVKDEEHQKLS